MLSLLDAATNDLAFPILLTVVVGAAGGILCGLGSLVTVPAACVALGVLYRNATGRPVAG